MHCNSLSLCETLGHVSYILTDKTGTLTKNELVLRELNVEDEMFMITKNRACSGPTRGQRMW